MLNPTNPSAQTNSGVKVHFYIEHLGLKILQAFLAKHAWSSGSGRWAGSPLAASPCDSRSFLVQVRLIGLIQLKGLYLSPNRNTSV